MWEIKNKFSSFDFISFWKLYILGETSWEWLYNPFPINPESEGRGGLKWRKWYMLLHILKWHLVVIRRSPSISIRAVTLAAHPCRQKLTVMDIYLWWRYSLIPSRRFHSAIEALYKMLQPNPPRIYVETHSRILDLGRANAAWSFSQMRSLSNSGKELRNVSIQDVQHF